VTPRKLHDPTARQLKAIKEVRHHIQNMDEKVADGRAELHLLVPLTKSVVIGSRQLHYRDLASCITKWLPEHRDHSASAVEVVLQTGCARRSPRD
jgi:hypothetical protein